MFLRRLIPLVCVLLLASCNRADRQLANAAIESLKQVRAATEVGMTYEQYSTRVIDAKAKVTAAMEKLTDDDPLKDGLNATMNCYADAVTIWQMKLNGQKIYMLGEPGSSLIAKYHVDNEDIVSNGTKQWANPDALLRSALAAGNNHLSKAIDLLNK